MAQMMPALGWGKRGMGKQLLLIRHGLKQRGQIRLHPRGSPTKTGEPFPLKGNYTSMGHETKGMSQWGARQAARRNNSQPAATAAKAPTTIATPNQRSCEPKNLCNQSC